jgi:hypothetical protein
MTSYISRISQIQSGGNGIAWAHPDAAPIANRPSNDYEGDIGFDANPR